MIKKLILLELIIVSIVNASVINLGFTGSTYLSEKSILNILGLKKQIVLEKTNPIVIKEGIKRLYQEGCFEKIWLTEDKKHKKLIFNFKEKLPIVSIQMSGYKENSSENEISDYLDLKIGSFYDLNLMKRIKKIILNDLSSQGYVNSNVEIKKEIHGNTVALIINVEKGYIKTIKQLSFNGNKHFNKKELEKVIQNKEKDIFGWLWGFNDGKFKKEEIKNDELRLKQFYISRGFLDVKIKNIAKTNINKKELSVNISIDEGKQFKVEKLKIISNIYKKQLNKFNTFKKNEIFNLSKFQNIINNIKVYLGNKGYAFPDIIPRISKNDKKNLLNIILEVNPGKKVRIHDIIIDGNIRTMDNVIRRELYLGPGDLYSTKNLKDSVLSLKRTGYFSNCNIFPKRINENSMDLIVKVKETKTGTIQIGGGYGNYGGFMGNLAISDRNLFGSGLETSLRLQKSQKTSDYSISLSNPKLNDSDYSGNFSIYQNNIEYNDYSVDTLGFSFGIGKRINRYLSFYTGYIYNKTDYYNLNNNLITTDNIFTQAYTKSSIISSLKYNSTNDFYIPTNGISSSYSIEKAGIGGEANFIKNSFGFNYYYGIKNVLKNEIVLRYKNHFRYIIDNGFIPLSERLYIGGINSVRGYQSYSISPFKKGTNNRIGGTISMVNTFEVSIPLKSKSFRVVTYLDDGFIGTNNLTDIHKIGIGTGIEWISPMGPIKILYSKPLLFDSSIDKKSNFEFSFGQSF